MGKVSVLIEREVDLADAFALFDAALTSEDEAHKQAESLAEDLSGFGLELTGDTIPIPYFGKGVIQGKGKRDESAKAPLGFAAFSSLEENPDEHSERQIFSCDVDESSLEDLRNKPGVTVWPNSELTLYSCGCCCDSGSDVIDSARSWHNRIDCSPFRPAATIADIRCLLGVGSVWCHGFRGQNVGVAVIDEGVNGATYPVVGGFSRPGAQLPGSAAITSHGSMCAADVLVAAPAAKIYDYPFLGIPNSGGAITMFNAALNERRRTGYPQITTNSYGFVWIPPKSTSPNHEIHDIDHPLHRKIREVIAAGMTTFFAAGNCGKQCPSGRCRANSVGPGKSIHASSALHDVITIAAVNSRHERIGYSSQGPGMFTKHKPDFSAYSHFYGNIGPGRPAGGDASRFDNGTSAATPVAAGVAALLLSAFPDLTPKEMNEALKAGRIDIGRPGWDYDTGYGVVNAAASFARLSAK